jgi:PAS domain S-box-containing protein
VSDPLRILLIDDNPDDRLLVLRELRREFADVQIEQLNEPVAFARVLETGDFEIAITDYQLRFTDGLTALRTIKARWPDVPVIMFTATGSEEIAVEAMKAGLDDYILKSPKHLRRLRAAVRASVENRRARAAARAVETRYHRLFAGVPVGLLRATTAGAILDANPALVQMLGYPSETALTAVRVEDLFVTADDHARWHAAIERDDIVREYESELRRLDGTRLVVVSSARVVRDPAGHALYYEGTLQDITERRRAEAELRIRARQQAAVAELGHRALAAVDLQTLMIDTVNLVGKTLEAGYCKVFETSPAGDTLVLRAGFAVEGLAGRTISAARGSHAGYVLRAIEPVVVEDFASDTRFTQPALLQDLGVVSGIAVAIPAQDQPFGVLGVYSPRRQQWSDDDVHFVQAVANVLAAAINRTQAEQALRRSETGFRALFEGNPHPMWLYDAETLRFIEVNSAAVTTYGYARAEFLSMRVAELVAPDEPAQPAGNGEGRWHGRPRAGEERHRRKDDRRLDVELTEQDLDFSGRRARLVLAQDITDRKRTEETLRQSEKLAAMGFLLAGVAHELNNPLSVVIGEASLLTQVIEDDAARDGIGRISRAANRCARIIADFLALARAQPAARQPVTINEILVEAVELLRYQLRMSGIEVVLELGADLSPVWADSHELHQVAINLITNAHQALRHAPPPRRLTLRSRTDPGGERVAFSVADTGSGIPRSILSRIFEPFFTTKPPGQGSGLGLALCQRIVQAHGGAIAVDTAPGRGAVFTVELPVQTLPVADSGPATSEMPPPVPGRTILVTEDEPDLARILTKILEAEGHRVETAPNGVQALARLGQRTFDLIVSDIRMPELDGPGLYGEVSRRYPDLLSRFVFLTGDILSPETSEFLARTGSARLAKPFTSTDVRRITRAALRARV